MLAKLSLPIRAVFLNRIWLLHVAVVLVAGTAWSQDTQATRGGSANLAAAAHRSCTMEVPPNKLHF